MSQMHRTLRTIFATAAAVMTGIKSMATRGGGQQVELERGDPAPRFELVGSDGITYRLADMIGTDAVVIAWFPKAFTGG